MSVADVSVAIAVAAFVVSLSTFLINRRRDRRDLFLRLHERLASIDQQRGRKLIHEMLRRQHKRVEDLGDDYEAINNALAMLNVACFYYVRRYISRKDWLEIWSVPIVRAIDAAEQFLAYRDSQVGVLKFGRRCVSSRLTLGNIFNSMDGKPSLLIIRSPRVCLVQLISGCDRIEVGHAARPRSIACSNARPVQRSR